MSNENEWVSSTPEASENYSLVMENDGDQVQFVDMTRDEFIALKAALAKMRGLQSD